MLLQFVFCVLQDDSQWRNPHPSFRTPMWELALQGKPEACEITGLWQDEDGIAT